MKFMMSHSWWPYKINLFNVFFLVEAASKLEPCVCLHQFLPASLSPFPNQCRPVLHVLQRTSDQHPKSRRFHDTCCLAANESYFTVFLSSTNHCSRSMTGLHSILSMHVNSSHLFSNIMVVYLGIASRSQFSPPSLLQLHPLTMSFCVIFLCTSMANISPCYISDINCGVIVRV